MNSPSTAAPKLCIDEAPFGHFHRRLTVFSCGGPFCDGYILGIVAFALEPLSRELFIEPRWQGLIAAAALIGMFFGGSIFGYLTDRIGRRTMYTLDLIALVLGSVAQYWVNGPWMLFVLRLFLGVAVGADYPIASALLSEFAPRRQRGLLLSAMIGAWWLGYTVSFVAGYGLSALPGSSWRWMLASSAVPAAMVVLLRWGMPESPRWLVAKGRAEEAKNLIRRHLGADYVLEEVRPAATSYRAIFRGGYLGRTIFVCVFWSCQIIPTFGIDTFAPDLLRALGSPNPALGAAVLSLFFLAGVIPAALLIDRVGRRPLLLIPFAVTGATLLTMAFLPSTATGWLGLSFAIFAMFNAGSSVLQWVYPSELFPTEVRATALGFATAVSRIAAAIGTFLFPLGLLHLGVSNVMLIMGAICVLGYLSSAWHAPETRGLSLLQSSQAARSPADERQSGGSPPA